MPKELVGANVVIVAQQFNPSVFSQLWLIRNHVMEEEHFVEGCLFSEQVAKIESRQFGLLVVPPQLQFQPRVAASDEAVLVAAKVGAIVRTIPHTPYKAVGLNYIWHVWPDNGDMHRFSRSLFVTSESQIYRPFADSEDAFFGGYMSRDILGCRLRLDVKPVDVEAEGPVEQHLQFAFNFQLSVPGDEPVPVIERHLQHWQQMKEEAERIVSLAVE